MPMGPYADFDACVRENQDKDNPDAYCGAIKAEIENSDYDRDKIYETAQEHSVSPTCAVSLLEDGEITAEDPCWEGYTQVGMKPNPDGSGEVPNCVPDDEVPDATGYENRALATRTLQIGPIEREASGETVRYNNVALLGQGVWTDQASRTPTLYDGESLANIEAEYDASEYDGPPVNIAHDLSATGEPNEASIGGYIDPESLTTDEGKLYGDIVLDTTTPAGDYADENLQSALSSGGKVGFGGPSVELDVPREHLTPAPDHPRAEEKVEQAALTGTGLVMDPASKNISFDRETATRAVALSNQGDKPLSVQTKVMADIEDLRGDLEQYNIDTEDMTDEDVMEFAQGLHSDLMDTLGGMEDMDEDMGSYMEDMDDEDMDEDMADMEDDMEDDEDMEMADYGQMMDSVDAVESMMEDVYEELEATMDKVSELETDMEDMVSMEQAQAELAAAEEVKELAETVEEIAAEPETTKTMADADGWNPEYDVSPSPDTGW
jgi:hypothetical protein